MNLLLKLKALALVVTSSVHAAKMPFVLRGSGYNEAVLVEVEASCSEGLRSGKKTADDLWRSMGQDCGDIYNLEKEANKEKTKKYPNSSNWRTEAYNECARDGVDDQVKKYEKECLESPEECEDLGKTAAELVVKDNYECSKPQVEPSASRQTDYKKDCRKVAYGVCEGHISTAVKTICRNPNERVRTTSELRSLQTKCEKQVNRMTGGDELKLN